MNLYLKYICCCFFVLSCSTADRIPKGVYSLEKMEDVLGDMMRADRFSAQYLLKDSSKRAVKEETVQLYERVLLRHHTTREDFIKSLQFYFNRPDLSRQLFDSIASRAGREKETVFRNIQ